MDRSLFSTLSKYSPTENVNPEENYSTELLVYLLRFSLENNTQLFKDFLAMFGNRVDSEDYGAYRIETQRAFRTSDEIMAYPDITIEHQEKIILIEVKVESNLNYYTVKDEEFNDKTIDQIQKYKNIICTKGKSIYLLSKYSTDAPIETDNEFKGAYKWYQIHKLLNDYKNNKDHENTTEIESFLIWEAIKYLEDKNMSIPRVTHDLENGVIALNSIFKQIEIVLDGVERQKSFGAEWLGYYVYDKKGWVGNYWEGDRLVFEQRNEKVVAHIKNKSLDVHGGYELSSNGKHYKSFFDLKIHGYFCLSAADQLDLLKKWIDKNLHLIKEIAE